MTSELGKALAARPGEFDRFSETLRWVGWMRFRYPDSRLGSVFKGMGCARISV